MGFITDLAPDDRHLQAPVKPPKPNPHQATIEGLRSLANFLESNPQLGHVVLNTNFLIYGKLKEIARKGLGKLDKEPWCDNYFSLVKKFNDAVSVRWFEGREEVCRRVVVGEKIIPAKPELHIPAKILPAEPERTEQVWEWQCPDSILKDDDRQSAEFADGVNGLTYEQLEAARADLQPAGSDQ